jgi:hypothetical protein
MSTPVSSTRRVSIELASGSSPIEGHLTDETGSVVAFTGWVGLIAELDRALGGPAGPLTGDAPVQRA